MNEEELHREHRGGGTEGTEKQSKTGVVFREAY